MTPPQGDSTPATLAEVLRTARESVDEDQGLRDLARQAGISHSQISRIESGKVSKPSREVLVALARALEMNPIPFLVVAGHLSGEEARAALLTFFREGSELVDEWGWDAGEAETHSLDLATAQQIVRAESAQGDDLKRVAAALCGYPNVDEMLWDDSYELAAARGEHAAELRQFLEIWHFVQGSARERWLEYGRLLRRLEDLEYQAEVRITEQEALRDAKAKP